MTGTPDTPPADERLRHLLGEICWLILHSPLHRALSMDSIERLFLVPAQLDQLRMYHRGARPVGLVTWAWLSPAAEAAHLAGERPLAPQEWRSGPQLWYPDFIAPFGDLAAIVRDARRVIPPGQTGLGARRGPDGSVRRVLKLYPLKD